MTDVWGIGITTTCTIDGKKLPSVNRAKAYVRETWPDRLHKRHPKRFIERDKVIEEKFWAGVKAIFQRKQAEANERQEVARAMPGG